MFWNRFQSTKTNKLTFSLNLFKRDSECNSDEMLSNAHHTIFDSISDGVLILDHDNFVISCNPSARRMIKSVSPTLSTDKLDNSHVSSILSMWPSITPFLSSTTLQHSTSVESKNRDGLRSFDLNITRIVDSQGEFTGRIILLQETTKLENAAKALRQRKQQLRLMVERLQSFDRARTSNFDSLDDEIRGSLTRIDLLLNNLRKGMDDGLNDAINRLEQEISNLYTRFERVTEHRHNFEPTSESNSMVNTVSKPLPGLAARKYIQMDR